MAKTGKRLYFDPLKALAGGVIFISPSGVKRARLFQHPTISEINLYSINIIDLNIWMVIERVNI